MFTMAGMMGSAASAVGEPDPVVAVWQTGIPSFGTFTGSYANDSIECTAISVWDYCGLVNYPMVAGKKYSIDILVVGTASPQRNIFGMSTTNRPGGLIYQVSPAVSVGANMSSFTAPGTIVTANFDGTTGVVSLYSNNVYRMSSDPATLGSNTWYMCVQEFKGYPAWRIVPQVYAPPSGYAKIVPTAP